MKVDEDKEKLVQSPLELIFGETRPRCQMSLEGPTWAALAEFKIISEHIGTRDLVQEFLAFRVFPTLKEWEMPKLEGEKKEGGSRVLGLQGFSYFKRMGNAEARGGEERRGTCTVTLLLQI